ncbi:hypothetical protein PBI_SCTP2_277 [Salicola phage SCTP-2]|nr:hypothetical protein PBI_SCTP2_277 [Salicola phage SCTP-2]
MSYSTKWIIDKYILDSSYHERLDSVLERNYIDYTVEQYIPFQRYPENIPYYEYNGPVIVYGSIEFVNWYCNNYYMDNPFVPGCYYDIKNFKTSYYVSKLIPSMNYDIGKNYFLNSDAIFVPFGMLKYNYNVYFEMFDTGKLFIRPDSGSKTFSGITIEYNDLEHELNTIMQLSSMMDHEWIMISSVKDIIDEYRYFIIDGQVIAQTQYMHKSNVYMDTITDDDCDQLAYLVANNSLQIDVAYVCDIAKLDDGSCRIVEFNSICSSGFYSANIDNIVKSLSFCADKEDNGELVKPVF